MKVELWAGHLSLFGQEGIKSFVSSNVFTINRVVIPSLDCYDQVYTKIIRDKRDYNKRSLGLEYTKSLDSLESFLTEKNVPLFICDDINVNNHIVETTTVISIAYPQILKNPKNVIGIHPSYLPYNRGANPVFWTLRNGDAFTGITAYHMTKGIDTGNILWQKKIEILEDDNYTRLYKKIVSFFFKLQAPLLKSLLEKDRGIPQNPLIASYNPQDQIKDHIIDWKKDSVITVSRKIKSGHSCFYGKSYKLNFTSMSVTNKVIKNKNIKNGLILKKSIRSLYVSLDGEVYKLNINLVPLHQKPISKLNIKLKLFKLWILLVVIRPYSLLN